MTQRGNNFLGLSFVPSGMKCSPALPTCTTPWHQAFPEKPASERDQTATNRKSAGAREISETRFSSMSGGK